MYLRVVPPEGEVRMTVPLRISKKAVKNFAASRIGWIRQARERILSRKTEKEPQYVSGEIHYLWGRGYALEVVEDASQNKVWLEGEKIIIQVSEKADKVKCEKLMREWYRRQLKEAVPEILERCVAVAGVEPDEWRIKKMRTRWGTCNAAQKRIWLSLSLAQKSPECLEYVIMHELVHFYVQNHGPAFQEYMNLFYPEWRKIRQKLNTPLGGQSI